MLVHVWEGVTQDGSTRDHMLTASPSFPGARCGRVTLVQSRASAPLLLHKCDRFEPLLAFARLLAAPLRAMAQGQPECGGRVGLVMAV